MLVANKHRGGGGVGDYQDSDDLPFHNMINYVLMTHLCVLAVASQLVVDAKNY